MSRRMSTMSLLACALLLACGRGADRPQDESPGDSVTSAPVARSAELEAAAADVVEYLRGNREFPVEHLADSVDLIVTPEGGGTRARRSRDELAARDAWTVDANGRPISFIPTGTFDTVRAESGMHFNCTASSLHSKMPDLAQRPHAGVLLSRADGSCMQTWNATFVFDTTSANAAIVAVVYDQWEW